MDFNISAAMAPHRLFRATLLLSFLSAGSVFAEPSARIDSTDLGIPFQRFKTTDVLDREITCYLSMAPLQDTVTKLPVVLFISGSGCQSVFSKVDDEISSGLQGLLLAEGNDRIRVLIVEKPGITFLDQPPRPGNAEGATVEFLTEHTLPRWAEANMAALRAVWKMQGVDPIKTMVMGHSEGGLVAARIAAEMPEVTHVACLASGGPTQLFSLAELFSASRPGDTPGDVAQRRQAVYQEWEKIQDDPESITRFWLGHPYRRWSSFLTHSLTEELSGTHSRIFLAHGTADNATPVTAFDILRAELTVRQSDLTIVRIEGADHGFMTEEMQQGSPQGFQQIFQRVIDWFLIEKAETH